MCKLCNTNEYLVPRSALRKLCETVKIIVANRNFINTLVVMLSKEVGKQSSELRMTFTQ